MILFFTKGEPDSDKFITNCYNHYRNIVNAGLPNEVSIIRQQDKKPYFNCSGIYFNLSHSHGVAVVAISHSEIGVDIEKIREIDYSKFPFADASNEEEFFEKWTERESYLKFTGEGLRRFKTEIPADAHFEHFPVFDGYHVCVCAEEQNITAYEIDVNMI